MRGNVNRRQQVFGEDAPEGRSHRHAKRSLDGLEKAVDEGTRLVHRHGIGIVIVGAGSLRDGERGHGSQAVLSAMSFRRSILPSCATARTDTSRRTALISSPNACCASSYAASTFARSASRAIVMCGS